MKKQITLLIGLALIACYAFAGQPTQRDFPDAPGYECVIDTYQSQIGVLELTGNNDGYEVGQYLSSTGLGEGYAWCAAFVNWSLEQCGYHGPKSPAWSPSWFTDHVIYTKGMITFGNEAYQRPGPGDVFGIYFLSKKRIAHVGFIDQWPNKHYTITVEGNTNEAGSREGDGVYRKYRIKSQIYKISRWVT